MRIWWRIRCGNHGDIFVIIHASHLSELNLCNSRTTHNLILTYQLSMWPVTSSHLTVRHTINHVNSRSGNGQKGTDHDRGFAGAKTRGVRICPLLKGLVMLTPAQENLSDILRIILSELTLYSVRLIYWTTLPVDHTASDDRLGWTQNYNTSQEALAKYVKDT